MARKKHAEEHVNLERWLVSYADFITLLFATFVVLYALSQLDLAKFKTLKISLAKAFSSSPTVLQGEAGMMDGKGSQTLDAQGQMDNQNLIPPLLDEPYLKQEKKDFEKAVEDMNKDLATETNKTVTETAKDDIPKFSAEITERGLVIKLNEALVFEPGTATLKKDYFKTLDVLGGILKKKFPNHLIKVEGHTDNKPMKSAVFPSNWELSSARASTIVRYVIEKEHLPANRFSAVGYADSRPIATNNTEVGRRLNRRVDVVVLKNSTLKTELVSKEFKKDLNEELLKFKNVSSPLKGPEKPPSVNEAVNNMVKAGTPKNSAAPPVVVFTKKDTYQEESAKILNDIKNREIQEEPSRDQPSSDDRRAKREKFFKSVRKSFKNKED